MTEKRETLGDNVWPLNYVLSYEPNLITFKYKCTETISINIKKPTKIIKINAVDLNVKSAFVTKGNATQKASIKTNKKLEQLMLVFKNSVAGNAELKFEFEGKNGDKLNGFYRSRFNVDSKEHYMLTTQFEAADARKAFPCFDEPIFKATFELSFLIDKKLTALSNMPEKEVKSEGSKKLVRFRRSPKMSSYLLYFGIGEFERLKGKYGKIDLCVVTTPGKIKLGETALDYGKKFLKYYEDYFGIPYPLPKLDFIAIPDYAIGGMENWGAITYSETGLLADTKAMSVAQKQRTAELTAHELAHMWFGDLVTMKWWDNLWLNESFATFMSYKAMNSVFPEWQMDIQGILSRNSVALGADQLRSTQPIGVKVNSPADMSEAFSPAITYSKGASVLTMLEDYIGKETFREALREYIKLHAYSNATEHDLWNSITKASAKKNKGKNIDKIASYWINTPGYPVVEVNYSNNNIELEQRRFFLLEKKDPSVWPIPVHYLKKTDKGKSEGLWLLDKKKMQMKENGLSYIKLNYMQKGFYRVKYPDMMLNKLGELIKSKSISALDGWGIETDLYSLALSCKIKVSKYLDFVERYCFESEFPLNMSVSGHLNGLYLSLNENKVAIKRIKKISLAYHSRILKKLGWQKNEKESNTTTLLRNTSIATLGLMGYEPVVEKANELFNNYLKKNVLIEPNIRAAVYRTVARAGNSSTLDTFITLYKKAQIPEDKIRFLYAIGSVKDPKSVEKALKYTFSKDIRRQYVDFIPTLVSSEGYGKKIIWQWTKSNWKRLMPMYDRGMGGLDDFVEILSGLSDLKRRKEIAVFFKKKENYRDDIRKSIEKTLEYIDIGIKFKEFNNP